MVGVSGHYDFELEQGSAHVLPFVYRQAQVDADGHPVRDASGQIIYNPVDNSGYVARCQVRKALSDVDPVVSVSEIADADGVIELGGANGRVTVRFTDDATADLKGKYLYDVFMGPPTGDMTKILGGEIRAKGSATR